MSSDSGRLTILKETACMFSEMGCAMSDQHTSNDVPMAALCKKKNRGSSKTNLFTFRSIETCMGKLKT